MAYTTGAMVASYTGGGIKSTDVKSEWIDWVTALIDSYYGMSFGTTVTHSAEKYDGNGTESLVLTYRPVVSVSSLSINNSTIDASSFKVYDWGVKLVNIENQLISGFTQSYDGLGVKYIFPLGEQNVSITYISGNSGSVPKDIEAVATMSVAKIALTSREGGGGVNQNWSQASVQRGDPNSGFGYTPSLQSEIMDLIKRLLVRKRHVRIPKIRTN